MANYPYPLGESDLLNWAKKLVQVLNGRQPTSPVTPNTGYLIAKLPSPVGVGAGATVYVIDEVGGGVLAFSDGADWRRVTDRAVVS